MQTVVGRIRQSLVDSDVRPTVDGLRVKEKKWTLAHTASDLRHILKNSGFTSEELGCRQIPLIDFEPAKSKPWNALSEKRSMESLPARRDFEEVDVDRALADWSSGISGALEILIPLVTDDLKRVARRLLAQSINSERDLEPEELVSELFFELVRMETTHARIGDPASLAGFLSFAHHQMSRIIYRRLRERASTRRFSGISINKALWGSDSATSVSQSSEVTIVDLDEALTVLEETEPELSKVVELRFFGGLTNTEIASTLEVSISTVGKQWRTARTWLRNQLTKPNEVVS
jgi:RNA polymerase sigma factor (TIGR02999 family)